MSETESPTLTRIVKDSKAGWKIEVRLNGQWYLKRWTAGTKADARKTETEVKKEMNNEM